MGAFDISESISVLQARLDRSPSRRLYFTTRSLLPGPHATHPVTTAPCPWSLSQGGLPPHRNVRAPLRRAPVSPAVYPPIDPLRSPAGTAGSRGRRHAPVRS